MHLGFITGSIGSGKTTLIRAVARSLAENGLPVGGFASEALWLNGQKTGYALVGLSQNCRTILCDRAAGDDKIAWGSYYFYKKTLAHGNSMLLGLGAYPGVVMIDEAGRFELQGGGWAPGLKYMLNHPPQVLILAVRDQFADEVSAWLGHRPEAVWVASGRSENNVVLWAKQALGAKLNSGI